MKWGGERMSHRSYGRYKPSWRDDALVTVAERHALRAELVSMLVLLFAAGVCMFGEQLLTWLGIGVR